MYGYISDVEMNNCNVKNRYDLDMNDNEEVWTIARKAALRVDFITNGRELHLYTKAIYSAIMWGWSERIEEEAKKDYENDNKLIITN